MGHKVLAQQMRRCDQFCVVREWCDLDKIWSNLTKLHITCDAVMTTAPVLSSDALYPLCLQQANVSLWDLCR